MTRAKLTTLIGLPLLLVAGAAVAIALHSRAGASPGAAATTGRHAVARHAARHRKQRTPIRLVERKLAALPAEVQDAAASAVGATRAMLLGGLTASDVSTDAILLANGSGSHTLGRLPRAIHDTAAVQLGSHVYAFGGGDGTSQLDTIVRVDPTSGATTSAGHLPAPSSDQSAAALGGTAYVVGGYTGTSWLDTIVAWRPGSPARVVAHLPSPVRYAAVTAVGKRIVIAGGSLPDGTASDAVLAYSPASRRVTRVGRLPAATTHAAAATLNGTAYVIGGRGASVGTPTSRIVAVDAAARKVHAAGNLSSPLSDLAAVTLGKRILLAGGRGLDGTESSVGELVPTARRARTAKLATAATTSVYAHDGANMLTGAARFAQPLVYVPNSQSGTVDVIDPQTFTIVRHFSVGSLPQHVVPAYDLKTLYVTNDLGNSLTELDPRNGRPVRTIPVDDPYNMYFTPDGRYAIVVAERLHRLDFRDAHTFGLHHSLSVPCSGVDHMDFSAYGSYALASCEFSGQIVKVDIASEKVVGVLGLPGGPGSMPQDVKLSPDGRVFYVADTHAGGIWEIDGDRLKTIGFLRTGAGAHGLYPSRNGKLLYVTNRGEGSVSVIDFATRRQVAKWTIPGGGSPDMGGVSADGKVLWLSGRYNGVVYALSTRNGRLLARIAVGSGPHGLCVWPQPGRYSLGHTGILR